jgi:hypothetical protein
MPTQEHVLASRAISQLKVQLSKQGRISFEEARASCLEYIRLAEARQMELYCR